MLGVCYKNMAIPLIFRMLDKRGNSNTEERIDLMSKFIKWFGVDKIDCLLADREFVGHKWIDFFAALATAMVCLSSCNKDSANNEETVSGVLKLELVANLPAKQASTKPTSGNVIAVLDIKSYNAKENIGEWKNNGYKVDVYANGDSRLFTVDFASSLFSHLYNGPVLYYSMTDNTEIPDATTEKDKWYILSGYPQGKVLTSGTVTDREQQESFKKIEAGWNIFVEALKKSGKYID